jgi:hypothetical protein
MYIPMSQVLLREHAPREREILARKRKGGPQAAWIAES